MFRKVFFLLLFSQCVFADMEDLEHAYFDERSSETLFVSLGSYCNTAHILRACSLRKAAFPFDWVCSFNINSVIEQLEEDFNEFLDDNYLVSSSKTMLLNSYAHLEFLHEGDFSSENYQANLIKFKEKYQRRIDRFKGLFDYSGKVVFIRECYSNMKIDRFKHFFFDSAIEISEDDAMRLYKALKIRFPILNFSLVIVNHGLEDQLVVEKNIRDEIIFVRSSPNLSWDRRIDLYQPFYEGFR